MRLSFCKTPGGKNSNGVLRWVISNFPPNYQKISFLEVFGGGISVTLNKDASPTEAVNDIYYPNYCMYSCFKNIPLKKSVPEYSLKTFEYYKQLNPSSDYEIAEKEYILRNMSRGGMKKDFAKSNRLRGGRMGDENAWINKVKQLPLIQKRLQNIQIFNDDWRKFMDKFNSPNCFAYLDPPYLHETRVSKKLYENEMSREQHEELVEYLNKKWKGLYLLSGYSNSLYDGILNWSNIIIKQVPNHMGQTKIKTRKTEMLWKNY